MPLEIWILLMTLFNVFLITTYLYYKKLHLSSAKQFEDAITKLECRIGKYEQKLVSDNKFSGTDILDEEFRR